MGSSRILRQLVLAVLAGAVTTWSLAPPARAGRGRPAGTLEERQAIALAHVTRVMGELLPYGSRDCLRFQTDARGLVGRLELDRRGLPDGLGPAAAETWALHLATALPRLQGRGGALGPCAQERTGQPSIQNGAAALAYALHRYGGLWSGATRRAIRDGIRDASWVEPTRLHNLHLPILTAELLAGEAAGDPVLLARGARHLDGVFDRTLQHGGFEINAPLYSAHHYPSLLFLLALRDVRARAQARILLEYELLVQAHSYLPGGGLGAPQSRDYAGGLGDQAETGLLPLLWLLIGDPQLPEPAEPSHSFVSAATDYRVPETIRSIFLDKGTGYEYWTYHDAPQGPPRTPEALYRLGPSGGQGIPWQGVMLPGGLAMLGATYGYTGGMVTSGTYTRLPGGGFAILYQYQPFVKGDQYDDGAVLGGKAADPVPDDGDGELYDFERLVHHRTALTLWDPRPRPGVRRTYPVTYAFVPRYARLGGTSRKIAGWHVSQVGSVYVAYHPLGSVTGTWGREVRDTPYTVMELAGPSGGIVELATTTEYPDIDRYAADLARRHVSFSLTPLAAEVDARDASGSLARLRLEYRPEVRFVDGRPMGIAQALGHGLLESPWTRWDATSRVLTLSRPGYPSITYDWDRPSVTSGPVVPSGPVSPASAGAPATPVLVP